MPNSEPTWNEEATRALYKKSVEVCERFFADKYGHERPTTAAGMAFHDLCLAEYEVRKHLLTIDCFSSREALVEELRRLLKEPVLPSTFPPCRADQYLDSQRTDIEVEIRVLTTEQNPRKKSWLEKWFGREEN